MPRKPKKPCAFPNCPKRCETRYCEEHQRIENKRYESFKRKYKVTERYGSVWRRIRKQYVQLHPYCENCFKEGKMCIVEEVHHKVPLAKGGTHDFKNLISLCKSCHARIHASDGSRWGR